MCGCARNMLPKIATLEVDPATAQTNGDRGVKPNGLHGYENGHHAYETASPCL